MDDKGMYYVLHNGERWSPICRLNDASRYYNRAQQIFEIAPGKHTIQLIQIRQEIIVGRG